MATPRSRFSRNSRSGTKGGDGEAKVPRSQFERFRRHAKNLDGESTIDRLTHVLSEIIPPRLPEEGTANAVKRDPTEADKREED